MSKLPGSYGQRPGQPIVAQQESDWIRRQLQDFQRQVIIPPKTIIPANLTAANIAAYFDATGLGKTGTDWLGWALCNGNNGTPKLDNVFPMWSTTAAGTAGGENTNTHSHAVTSNVTSAANTGTTAADLAAHFHANVTGAGAILSVNNVGGSPGSIDLLTAAGGPTTTNPLQTSTEGTGGGHAHTAPALTNNAVTSAAPSDSENRPAFSSIVPVMKL